MPASIVRKDLIPKMQDQPDYLTRQPHPHFRRAPQGAAAVADQLVFGRCDALYVQAGSGQFNSLGSIRINFPSQFGVYMHDTPLKNLFGEDFRFHSSGCVRVQNVRQLVAWLLDGTKGWCARTSIA